MHDSFDEAGGGARRRFLQLAGLAAAGLSVTGRPLWAASRTAAGDDCACGPTPALPLYAVALHQGAYCALASTGRGLALHALDVDASQRVTLGRPLDVAWPSGFLPSSLGVADGRLVLTGGLPFVWDSLEVDDELDGAVKDAMEDFPPHVPLQGRRRIDVTGLRPAWFEIDGSQAVPLALPELPRRVFGVLGGVTEMADGAVAVLHEHCGALRESWYASSVDVLVRRGRAWQVLGVGEGLGESGPNLLAPAGDDVLVGLRGQAETAFVLARGAQAARVDAAALSGRVLGLTSGTSGPALFAAQAGGAARGFALEDGAWRARAELRLPDDEIVGALPVAGARGQSVLLGRRSAALVEETSVLWGRGTGGERHVV